MHHCERPGMPNNTRAELPNSSGWTVPDYQRSGLNIFIKTYVYLGTKNITGYLLAHYGNWVAFLQGSLKQRFLNPDFNFISEATVIDSKLSAFFSVQFLLIELKTHTSHRVDFWHSLAQSFTLLMSISLVSVAFTETWNILTALHYKPLYNKNRS